MPIGKSIKLKMIQKLILTKLQCLE